MEYKSLAQLRKIKESWLKKIHEIDKDIGDNILSLTLSQIQDRKKPQKQYQAEVDKINTMISNGEYEEAQNKLFK